MASISAPCTLSASKLRRLRSAAVKQKLFASSQRCDPLHLMQAQLAMLTTAFDNLQMILLSSMFPVSGYRHDASEFVPSSSPSSEDFFPAPTNSGSPGVPVRNGVRRGPSSERMMAALAGILAGKSPEHQVCLESSNATASSSVKVQCPLESAVQEPPVTEAEWITLEPKRPPSAYFLYLSEGVGAEPASCRSDAALADLQKRWQSMDSLARSHYASRAEQLQSQYEVQRSEYLQFGRYRASVHCIAPTVHDVASRSNASPQLGALVTIQHFHDGLRAGIEGVARTTATHFEKLEQRIAAVERQEKTHQNLGPGAGSQLTSMTGFTRLIQGIR